MQIVVFGQRWTFYYRGGNVERRVNMDLLYTDGLDRVIFILRSVNTCICAMGPIDISAHKPLLNEINQHCTLHTLYINVNNFVAQCIIYSYIIAKKNLNYTDGCKYVILHSTVRATYVYLNMHYTSQGVDLHNWVLYVHGKNNKGIIYFGFVGVPNRFRHKTSNISVPSTLALGSRITKWGILSYCNSCVSARCNTFSTLVRSGTEAMILDVPSNL